MKITVLYLGKSGAGCIYTYEMILALLSCGIDLQIIVSDYIENKKDYIHLIQDRHCNIIFVPTYNNKTEFVFKSFNLLKFRNIASRINSYNPDWLYVPMITIWGRFIVPFLDSKIKIATTIHDVSQHLGEHNTIIDKFNTYMIRKSNKIVTLSKTFVDPIAKKYNKDNKDICWIRHANYDYYLPKSYRISDLSELSKRILFFGRIHEYKGISVLLDAMKIIKNVIPDMMLRIAGKGIISNDLRNKLDTLAPSIELSNKWISNEDIYYYFDNVDLVVAPYIEASQSGVVMLAYSFGKPVVVTDVGGLPEQVFQDTGIVVRAGDPEDLARNIIKLYNTPNIFVKMQKAIIKNNTSLFSWQNSAESLIKFLSNDN